MGQDPVFYICLSQILFKENTLFALILGGKHANALNSGGSSRKCALADYKYFESEVAMISICLLRLAAFNVQAETHHSPCLCVIAYLCFSICYQN